METQSIKNILFPTSLDLNQSHFVSRLVDLQNYFSATLHILLINTPQSFKSDAEAQAALQQFAELYGLADYKLHWRNAKTEENGIVDFTLSERVDLVAMGTHARKGIAHLFNDSITEKVVNHIHTPIWTSRLNGL